MVCICIPILHVRGTHFSVGYSIGRMFKGMIQDLLCSWSYFNEVLWKSYLSENGKALFDTSLAHCTEKFPQYVDEIRGMAEGSGVAFEKLFLINIDSIITDSESEEGPGEFGCTSIICNKDEVILGHTEDAPKEILNNVYIVSAEILDESGKKLEKFTTFTYAGHLVGYTMGYNDHGMVHSVNTLFPSVHKTGTPRAFIARAILSAHNLDELLDILRDNGSGISDGFSLNVYFANESPRVFYNIEVSPPTSENKLESVVDVLTVNSGESSFHCNKYLRINNPHDLKHLSISVSTGRQTAIESYPEAAGLRDIKVLLSDQSDKSFPIYICDDICTKMPHFRTVAVGIFDLLEKTWAIYLGKPETSEPVVILPLIF